MSSRIGKRLKAESEKNQSDVPFLLQDAITRILGQKALKFDESVDIDVKLGVDTKQSDQQVRGVCLLPNGSGKKVRVAVFAKGDDAESAKKAGADLVGAEDLAEKVEAGEINFDHCIATPSMMGVVGRLGRVLGPRNLMPNPKLGTVTTSVDKAVKNAKGGSIQIRADKGGVVHATIGRRSFKVQALTENLQAVMKTIQQLKPSSQKGRFICKVSLSSTMGPGFEIDTSSIAVTLS